VIREIVSGMDAQSVFENELESALESKCDLIVIEPDRLGEETVRWIRLGDCLHSTAMITGSGSVVSALLWEDRPYVYCPLTGLSLFCASFFRFSWKEDPCSVYRPATEEDTEVQKKAENMSGSAKRVVLVRKDEPDHRSLIHSAVAVIAMTISAWKLYRWIKFVAA